MNLGKMASVETIFAERFDAVSTGGATKPLRMACVSSAGKRIEVYVRYNSEDCPVGGLVRDLIGCLLAKNVGIAVADIALVEVPNELIAHIRETNSVVAKRLSYAVAPKLGSISAGSGYQLCSSPLVITPGLRAAALKMWVFDELIFNFDRTHTKPNCLFKGNDLIAIDHEKSLNLSQFGSFLCPKMPWDSSWRPNESHVFYDAVKPMALDFALINNGWDALNTQLIDCICSTVPTAWGADEVVEQIRCYLQSLHQNIENSLENLRSAVL